MEKSEKVKQKAFSCAQSFHQGERCIRQLEGCDDSVLQAVVQSGADKVFYISCNPATLARDLKTLCEVYNIDRVTPFDMFPQTRHVETLAVLGKEE